MASKAQGQQTRERLIQAATTAFVERGFRETSLTSIANEAGVTRQALLHYFPSKSELLTAVFDASEHALRQVGWESSTGDVDWQSGLIAIMEREREDPRVSRLHIASVAESADPGSATHEHMRRREERARREMTAAVEQEQAAGRLTREMDAQTIADGLLALFSGLALRRILQPDLDVVAPLAGFLRALST